MERKMKGPISQFARIIGHEGFWVFSLSILLIPQVASSVKVFTFNNTQYESPWFAWCYAIGIDLAILIFTVKGQLKIAFMYLVVMIAHALIGQFLPYKSSMGIMLVHTTLPVTIFSFSHLFYYRNRKPRETMNELTTDQAQLIAINTHNIRLEAQPYLCPECGFGTSSPKKLNGHISGHKSTGDWHPESYGDFQTENEGRAIKLAQLRIQSKKSSPNP